MPLISGSSSSSMGGHVSSPRDHPPATLIATWPEPSPAEAKLAASGALAADITRRFGTVLEAIRTAEFHDFD
jgi:hypothetical protein